MINPYLLINTMVHPFHPHDPPRNKILPTLQEAHQNTPDIIQKDLLVQIITSPEITMIRQEIDQGKIHQQRLQILHVPEEMSPQVPKGFPIQQAVETEQLSLSTRRILDPNPRCNPQVYRLLFYVRIAKF